MYRKGVSYITLLAVILAFIFPAAAPGAGAEEPESAQTDIRVENIFLYPDDLVVQGVVNRHDSYFQISESRALDKTSYLEFVFSHSPVLLPEKSTITFLLDDIPLDSLSLDGSNSKKTTWRKNMADFDLAPGFHKLSVVAHMEISQNLCQDQTNPANWLILHKESRVQLSYREGTDTADLMYYPAPFLEKGSLEPLRTIFVVPDRPEPFQLKALLALSSFLAAQAPDFALSFQTYRESDVTGNLLQKNMIWIGNEKQWGEKGKQLAKAGAVNSVIKLLPSPWNSKSSVLAINGSDKELLAAVQQLTTPDLYQQLTGQSQPIWQINNNSIADTPAGGGADLTLEYLGYEDLTVEGSIGGTVNIPIPVPVEVDITKAAKVKLYYKHSKVLNYARSFMTVKINGKPVMSRNLTTETSDHGVMEIDIPAEMLANRNLVLDVVYQFGSGADPCVGNLQIGNWAVISKKSVISFNSRPNQSVLLENLPYPFVTRSAWNNTLFVVPESPSSEELSLLTTFGAMIGKSARAFPAGTEDTAVQVAFHNANLPSVAADKHIIYIGSADKVPAGLLDNQEIPVKFAKGEFMAANASVVLLPKSKDGLIMTLFSSPFAKDRKVLVVMADNQEALKRANQQISDTEIRGKIMGKTVFIDALNRVNTVQAVGEAEEQQLLSEQVANILMVTNDPLLKRAIFVALFVAVLGLTGLILWMLRKRTR